MPEPTSIIRRRLSSPACFALTLGLIAICAVSAGATETTVRPQYDIKATVSLQPSTVYGTVSVQFTNHSDKTVRDAVIFLYPNRFSADKLTDLARPFIHPEEEFDEGSLTISEVLDDGYPTTQEPVEGLRPGIAIRVRIAPLKPGQSRRLGLGFRTEIPHRFGGFGEFENQLTLLGGWHPYLAALGQDGTWLTTGSPPMADYQVTIRPTTVMQVALNGTFRAGATEFTHSVSGTPYLSLIASPRLLKATRQVGATEVTLLLRPKRFAFRLVPGPDAAGLIMNAAEEALLDAPAGVPSAPRELLLIEAPLRMHLIEPSEGMVVFSDRLYKTFGPLREFHRAHLVEAIYQEVLRPRLAKLEAASDYGWVAEAYAHELASRYMDAREPERRLLTDWLDMFDFLAVVDRFEKVPKIPFVSSFFQQTPTIDPGDERIMTFNGPRPPGRIILSKVRDLVGEDSFDEMLNTCLTADRPLRACASERFPGQGINTLLDQWAAAYPTLNYWIEEVDFNEPDPDSNGNRYKTTVQVRRESSRPVREPVTVRLRTIGGSEVDVKWNAEGEVALLSESTDDRVYQVYIDPEEKLIETRRDDNAWLPRLEVLLDGADIAVSSTQFGFGTNIVSRIYQDYRKDLALTATYTNRGVGFAAGPRFHFGEPIDVTRYRHNLHMFYSYTALDSDFDHLARPNFITTGNTAGLGVRYDYTDVFYDQNPSLQRQLRLHADWHDRNLGSDFDYVSWGYNASVVFPVVTPRTLIGFQAVNNFSRADGDSVVPNQGLYSLGGSRSIRGIGFGDKLGRNLFVLRGEVRQSIYPELDLNLLDLVTLRRTQFRVFADGGNVSDSAGRVYDPSDWAVGVGLGFGLVYEAAGFFPAIAFIEVATRVDKSDQIDDVQVLFGTKQSF